MNQFLLFADEQVEQEKEEQEGVVKLLVVNQLELDKVRVAGLDYLHGNAKEIQKKRGANLRQCWRQIQPTV